jgi:hypothetical protein
MSKSLPFIVAPKNTAGWIGNADFDPLGFSEYFDMKWLRESELKHSRAAMLASLGFVVQQYITIPGYVHVDDSNLAPAAVGLSPMLQIVFGMGILEFYSNNGKVTMETMFEDPARVPGNFGFDPLGFGKNKSQADKDTMALKELTNGRLAMLAIGGMIHHNFITGQPLF